MRGWRAEGDVMRRFMAVPMAGLLALTLAASALAGPNVGNFSGSLTLAQANWDSWDDASQTYSSGYVAVGEDQNGNVFAEYSEFSQQYVQCTGADTPDNPDDDTFGAIGSSVWGYGSPSMAITKNFASATASGTLEASRETFNECTGEYGYEGLPALAFSLDLTATSAAVKESGRGSFHLPGEFNSHSSYKATYRFAEGTVDVGGSVHDVYGQIGKISWMDHSNG